jgi:hypothetical protein
MELFRGAFCTTRLHALSFSSAMHKSEAGTAHHRPATREFHETLQTMRKRQTTDAFQKSYAARAGIEGTHAQAIRRSGLRRTRYRGLPKTHLQHVITAAAINLLRIAAWANGTPLPRLAAPTSQLSSSA